ncbi:MAG TPA: cysteine desulfurase family protein [Opitutales bacterium]|nr:cysteine desulfurase family protein [Opitutales bacterium]
MIYFDWNATTPLSSAARKAWLEANETSWQNSSSLYRSGARVHNLLEEARNRLANSLGCTPDQIVFNSGATEGVNSVFAYYASKNGFKDRPVLLSPFEHSSVVEAAKHYFGNSVILIEKTNEGRCDPEAAEKILKKRPFAFVSMMAASNETGAIQPWQPIAKLCRDLGIPFLCDAAQWIGKCSSKSLGMSGFVTASAHKFGGPKGCGFLIVPKDADDFRGFVGGEQENGRRAGTVDYPSIAAMVAAFEESENRVANSESVENRLKWRQHFEKKLQERLPGTKIAGAESERLWNTVFLIAPKGNNDRWVRRLNRAGFEVSTGSACSTRKNAPSQTLAAIGFSEEESRRAIRISSGWETTEADWVALADALESINAEMLNDSNGAAVIQL